MARKRLFSCYGREGLVRLMGRREAGFMEGWGLIGKKGLHGRLEAAF
jgi:hypothetical protein